MTLESTLTFGKLKAVIDEFKSMPPPPVIRYSVYCTAPAERFKTIEYRTGYGLHFVWEQWRKPAMFLVQEPRFSPYGSRRRYIREVIYAHPSFRASLEGANPLKSLP